MNKSVLIIYTGGTIGMQHTPEGDKPEPGLLLKLLQSMPVLKRAEMPSYTVIEFDPLIDSSNLTPTLWNKIAQLIYQNYHKYDSFIVLHGTDTMAYTASALSFMLENLNKPVIITGSQVPLIDVRNDASDNIINSMYIASYCNINEVCLFFHGKLFRGNRAKKVSSIRYAAFASPNFSPLGTVEIEINLNKKHLLQPTNEEFSITKINKTNIAILKLFPGINRDFIQQLLNTPLKALIISTYGQGNAPDDPKFLRMLKNANDQGVILVNCTQCAHGYVDMENYAAGRKLAKIGLISAHDMTFEATITKLYYLLSCHLTINHIKEKMQQNLRGELTPR